MHANNSEYLILVITFSLFYTVRKASSIKNVCETGEEAIWELRFTYFLKIFRWNVQKTLFKCYFIIYQNLYNKRFTRRIKKSWKCIFFRPLSSPNLLIFQLMTMFFLHVSLIIFWVKLVKQWGQTLNKFFVPRKLRGAPGWEGRKMGKF